MKNLTLFIAITALVLTSCGGGNDIDSKKEELSKLNNEKAEIENQIATLEKEISELDPTYGVVQENATLVTVMKVANEEFTHRVDVRGTVESKKNVMISTEIPALIRSIKVREGDRVKKGQLLIVLDSETLQRNIDELETALDLAKIIFERQSQLWEQNVGSEIQYLEAKNRKEALEKSLATANSQLQKARIKAPFSGTIDEIPVKEGEFAMTGMPMVRVVSLDQLYINADVSENFIGKFNKGDKVTVSFPSINKEISSKILSVSDVINRQNRTFSIELDLGSVDFKVKPNMVVIAKLTDYTNNNALVIPTNIIQRDDIGNFVFTLENSDNQIRAKKNHIDVGMSYNSKTEVTSGLTSDDSVVDKGFRELNNGTLIQIVNNETISQL